MTTISTKCGNLDLTKHIDSQFIETVLAMGSWHIHNSRGYIEHMCKSTKLKLRLHRVVYELQHGAIPAGLQIDHIDCCRTNNFLSNLRVVTHQQNQWNRIQTKGYRWDKNSHKWRASIKLNNKSKSLGSFSTESEARQAYLDAKAIYHVIP